MNSAQSQEVATLRRLCEGVIAGMAKRQPRADMEQHILQRVYEIRDRLQRLLETNRVFEENVSDGPSSSPKTVYRPFSDVLNGFSYAVAAKAVYLNSGRAVHLAVLFNPDDPGFTEMEADEATYAALKDYANLGSAMPTARTITARAKVVSRKENKAG